MRFAKMFEEQLLLGRLTKKAPSKTTALASGKLIKVGMLVILVLVSLPIIGFPISSILAFSGGSAIVVGIAIKPILANYFGGLMIYSDRFFEVGDWIHSPDKEIEGTVEDIGWRSTRIRTFEKRPLYVPNSLFSEVSVINATRMSNRRIKENIGIRYEDSTALDKITKDIRTMLKEHPEIDTKQTLLVHFTDFGPSSLNINVYAFTRTRDWKKYRDIQQDVFLNVIKIIEDSGAKLAVPERRLDINPSDGKINTTKEN
ncbi:MAG: mechanosensitive ion channel family protein [Bacteroidetes bacterium]|nr:mechanosensitive ion channel family protein [Bacteroidota bacterium]